MDFPVFIDNISGFGVFEPEFFCGIHNGFSPD